MPRSPSGGYRTALTAARAVAALSTCGTWMPCTPMSNRRRMKAGSKPGVRTIGVMPTRSAAITQVLHVMQIEAGVLHVDKGGVEPCKPDDLDDLRIGDAADMRAEREPTPAHDPLHPVFLHGALPIAFFSGTQPPPNPPHKRGRAFKNSLLRLRGSVGVGARPISR